RPWQPTVAGILGLATYFAVGLTVGVLSNLRSAALERARARHAEALAEQERLTATFACMADAVLVVDQERRITRMNPVAERLTGWSATEAMGRPLIEVFRLVSPETHAPVDNLSSFVLAHGGTLHEN